MFTLTTVLGELYGETSVTQNSSENQSIKESEMDPKFKYALVKLHGSEKILRCFQCGICTSDCPVARYNNSYQPRMLIRMASLGLKERVLKSDSLWLCAACFACTDRCPQNIEVASVIRVFRNLAVENGCLPQVFKDQIESVLESGYAFRIPELRVKKRELQNLPPLPKGNAENVYKVLKGTKIFEKNIKCEETV
jgi:heterodisulfide reductase subunit C